jgi:pimeloyl-ACP methyl ester carboxylesterase
VNSRRIESQRNRGGALTKEDFVRAHGVELCVETFGDPSDSAMLLIAGATGSVLSWEEQFCERLAAGSRFVIRYDQRDTGRSVTFEPGASPYTFDDLVADVVGLLDALGLHSAHLVGLSMGGAIALLAALDHPDRVASLTLIATSPSPGDPDLPAMSDEIRTRFEEPAGEPDWSDRTAVIEYIVEGERPAVARSRPFDEAAKRELAGRVFDRAINIASSMRNHWLIDGGDRWGERLGEVSAPTLVLHGTEDPLFPFPTVRRWRRRFQAPDLSEWSGPDTRRRLATRGTS